jgi:hypothetical protein
MRYAGESISPDKMRLTKWNEIQDLDGISVNIKKFTQEELRCSCKGTHTLFFRCFELP